MKMKKLLSIKSLSKQKLLGYICLTAILLFALFLRLYQLADLPISLFGDEIDVGYHAWSLASTGRDYMGNLLPSYIQSLAEWRTPLLSYFITPFVSILGLSPFSLRLPVVLLGVLNVYLLYLLTNQLLADKKLNLFTHQLQPGLIAALFLAITPWHLHFSRIAVDFTLLLSFLLLGIYFFLKGLKSAKFYFFSALCFSLTFYTYATANVFIPLLLLSLWFVYRKQINFKKVYPATILALVVCLPISYHLLFGQAAGRFGSISLFSNQEITYQVVTQRTQPWVTSPLLERLFHNKITAYFTAWISNYLNAFSPQFLFLTGDPNYRHSINTHGELLLIFLPLILFGLYHVCKNLKQKSNQLLLLWLLLSPLPSSLTQDGANHAIRLSFMLPVLILISFLGLYQLLSLLKTRTKNLVFSLIILFSLFNLSAYWYQYSAHYRYQSARHWNYGYQQIMEDLRPHLTEVNHLYVNNTYEPSLLRFVFFTAFSPSEFQADFSGDIPDKKINDYFTGFPLGEKYYFGQIDSYKNLNQLLEPGDIYLAVQGEEIPGDWNWSQSPPDDIRVLSMITDVLGKPLFYLLTLE